MYRALTAQQSRSAEEAAIVTGGMTVLGLMRAAGAALAREVLERVPEGRIVVLCGRGNNGGDGWVAAHVLRAAGRDVRVVALAEPGALEGAAADAAAEADIGGVPWAVGDDGDAVAEDLSGAAVAVDAILGTGASLPLREPVASWCRAMNASGAVVISADMPTGVDSDTGAVDEAAVSADCTVTFATAKRGLVLFPGAAHAGDVVVADIGIAPEHWDVPGSPELWTESEYAALLPLPAPDAHKNSRGRVLVIAGSGAYPGAAVLAARGAMRMGAGYVTVAVPDTVVRVVQSHLAAAPVVGLPSSRARSFSSNAASAALDLAHDYDAVVLGPGLTLADGAVAVVRALVRRLAKPLVIDADGLNALVDAAELVSERSAPTVLTPHPGELARLTGVSPAEVQADRVSSSARYATATTTVVLKGAGTIISGESRQVVTTSGSPALATAGTGDVLAGMVGALLAKGMTPLTSGAVAAYVHGKAGEVAASRFTPLCATAEDLPDCIAEAVGELLGTW